MLLIFAIETLPEIIYFWKIIIAQNSYYFIIKFILNIARNALYVFVNSGIFNK